ncbi:MAG: prolipoprotein diacylglyceryl transferase [Clostridiales bacterium]|nr:prolipoprotein diacylglyceryl transferase [Clostridiales bacterium]
MLPTITIFGKTIAMYGLMIVLGLFIGIGIAIARHKSNNFKKDDIIFASCYAGIGLVIGAKLLYILTTLPQIIKNWDVLVSDINNFYQLLTGGFVFYGGFIGAAIGFYIYCRQYNLNTIKMLDFFAPIIPIIHSFGRIGCFFAGCCYGINYEGLLHIIFEHSPVAPNGIPLFPIQLVESASNLSFGIILLFYAKKTERKPGKVIGLYVIYYAIMRFTFEFLRGDIIRGFFLNLSTSQWISFLLLPIGVWLFFDMKIKKKYSSI